MTNKNKKLKQRAEREAAAASTARADPKPQPQQADAESDVAHASDVTDDATAALPNTGTKSSSKKKKSKKGANPPTVPTVARDYSLNYLHGWHADRSSFKFQKVRQTWLVNHAFNRTQLPKHDFEVFLAYVADMKGASRQRLADEAQKIVYDYRQSKASPTENSTVTADENAADGNADGDDAESASVSRKRAYQRAKKMLEALA